MTVLGSLLVLASWCAWNVWQARAALTEAEASLDALQVALLQDDQAGRDEALGDFQEAASRADNLTSGITWRALSALPGFGDDASAIAALSGSLDTVAQHGAPALLQVSSESDGIVADGRIDIEALKALQAPVDQARTAFVEADAAVADVETDGLSGSLGTRFDRYRGIVNDLRVGLESASLAVKVLPKMVGGERPQNYLLLFQNNAEIRATGGIPGSWALVTADAGQLAITRQGAAADFPVYPQRAPLGDLSAEEIAVYGPELGRYFQDPGFTPDFPRAAEIFEAFWRGSYPDVELDGVLAIDPVGLSYVLEATGPVVVDGYELTSDNAVESLLSLVYENLAKEAQDAFFEDAAREVFDAVLSPASPLDLAYGLARAGSEGRLLVAPFDDDLADQLAGTRVAGALPEDDGEDASVFVGLNDATGAKMSYYLRYDGRVTVQSCADERQVLAGTLSINQTIDPVDAAKLSPFVTGAGAYGTPPGQQLVFVRLYGPVGGSIDDLAITSRKYRIPETEVIGGRPVVTLPIQLATDGTDVVTWTMTTAPGQVGEITFGMTPGVEPRDFRSVTPSEC